MEGTRVVMLEGTYFEIQMETPFKQAFQLPNLTIVQWLS
jgi:hypothetical protein